MGGVYARKRGTSSGFLGSKRKTDRQRSCTLFDFDEDQPSKRYGAETLNTATFVQWPIWWRKIFQFWYRTDPFSEHLNSLK